MFNDMLYQIPKLFPSSDAMNKVICLPGNGSKGFSALMTDAIPDLEIQRASQCFPLYYYEPVETATGYAPKDVCGDYVRRYAITDEILDAFQRELPDGNVTKENIFYYVYGALHSLQYREIYKNELLKGLPRLPIPVVRLAYQGFVDAGKKLAELHLGYERVEKHPGVQVVIDAPSGMDERETFRVKKMRYAKKIKDDFHTPRTLIYNDYVTIRNIPGEAYEYVVNGRTPIDWVVERYQIKVDEASGIVNDPNDWGAELKDPNPRYIVDLIARLATVSVETIRIQKALPNWSEKSFKS